jgi:hypothetical protein
MKQVLRFLEGLQGYRTSVCKQRDLQEIRRQLEGFDSISAITAEMRDVMRQSDRTWLPNCFRPRIDSPPCSGGRDFEMGLRKQCDHRSTGYLLSWRS